MIIIGFYTKSTPYQQVFQECLLPGLQKFNLKYDIIEIESRGNWSLNTAFKSKLVFDMLEKYKQAVIYLDVDALIVRYPELLVNFPNNYDLGYHHFKWYTFWRGIQDNNGRKPELLSGTMCFNYTPKTLKIVAKWYEQAYNNDITWEQKILQEIVNSEPDLNIYDLPIEYCTILKKGETESKIVKEPIIIHTQASRKYRNWYHEKN